MAVFRTKRFLASLTTLALVPGLTVLSLAPPAAAALPPVSPDVTAATSVDTLAADVLGLTLPFPLGSLTAASLDLGDVTGAVNGVNPRTEAHAANLGLNAAGIPLGGILSSADQAAPPDNASAATGTTIPTIAVPPVLSAGISNSSAHARWSADNTCLVAGTPLTTSSTTTADVALLDLPVVGPLLSLPGEVTTSQSVRLASVAGGVDDRQVVAQTRSTLVAASLFGSIGVGVSEAPVLTATASGEPGGASVTYSQPVVTLTNVSLPGGQIVLDAANDTAAFVLPENPLLSLELSLGTLTEVESADGTSATGSTALLHVRLFLTNLLTPDPTDGVDVATVDLIPMSAEATAPSEGIECGEADTSTFVTVEVPGDGTTTDARPTFSGTKEPGASVVVTDASGDVVCSTTADASGAWSCTPAADLEDGTQVYTATATDAAGNTATDTVTLTVDSAVAGGVTILTPADGSTTTDNTPLVSGVTEPGAEVVVTDANGNTVCTATAAAVTGAWSCTPTTALPLGANTLTATATDGVGNTATDTTTFTVAAPDPGDTTAPVVPVITSPAEGSSTGDTAPTVTGTAEPGSTVIVTEGGTVICTAVADGAGNWSCTPTTPMAVGPHTLSATATDAAGNTSPADTVTFTIAAPANPDRDGDGLPNTDETKPGTNPDDPDTDNDGLTDGQEVDHDGAGPDQGTGTDPLKADTDGDGLTDGQEVHSTKTDPLDPDTDNDGLEDGPEVNGMTIKERFELCGKPAKKKIRVTTNPLVKDTDKDGLTDGLEVKGYRIKQVVFVTRSGEKLVIGKTRSNPTKADTDKDKLKDKAEKTGSANKKYQRRKSDPTKCDTDQGGVSDGREVKLGSDPSRIKSGPNDLESRRWNVRSGIVSGG